MSDITTLMMAASGGAAEETDENFNQTVLLLHGDGTNGAQNNTFLDSSSNGFSITRNGNTTQGTFSPFSAPDGRWSNYFDGTGDYLSLADNAAFTLGSSDFTIECWLYNTTTSAREFFAGQIDSGGTNASASFFMQKSSTNKLVGTVCSGSTSYVATSTNDLPSNQWVHVALVRDGNTLRQYINGVQDGTASVTGVTVNNSTQILAVGRAGALALDEWTGYISNFRQVVGTCLYTGGTTFTPPTTPLTNITNTSLLTCQSNRFVDNSTNNFAITRNGDVKVTPFSPYSPSASYSPSVNGGSGYFDGTTDTLDFPNNSAFAFGTGAFTIDFWINAPSNNDKFILEGRNAIGTMHITTGGASSTLVGALRYVGSSTIVSSNVITDNSWHHCAIVRDGSNNITLYVDGVSRGTGTDTTNYTTTTGTFDGIGGRTGVGNYLTGNIASFRIMKGVAVDFSSVGIPTAPPTSDANTSLLLNLTNAGIFDNTGKNNLETVGNAQIDTTVKKYGTGSMKFDGTGDWLQLNSSTNDLFNFGTGDFTVECWFYRGSTSGRNDLLGRYVSTPAGWGIATSITNAGDIGFYYGNTVIATTSASAWAINTWTHVAVVRSGTSLVIYVNGISSATATNSTNMVAGNPLQVGASGSSTVALNGYIDDLRITKGVARYTTTFTPPDKAFADL